MIAQVILHRFAFSNYCEKVNWAADYKSVPYTVREYLPFLHRRPITKLSGQALVPVLEDEEHVVAGSARIVDHLETKPGHRSLFPEDPAERAEAMAWQKRLDPIGATLRAALFYDIFEDRDFGFRLLTAGGTGARIAAYKLMFSAMLPKMKKMLAERASDPERLRVRVREALDDVERASSETGYIVGSRFSIADLTAAALFFPTRFPEGAPGAAIARGHKVGKAWLRRWEAHPATAFVDRMYAAHR
ncbi:MAG: glutathione S-transferase family protein [Myxococcota bacterium]